MREFAKELKKILGEFKGPSPYDTSAVVKRVEDGTAWVHIPGGVDETPVDLTVNAVPGDKVMVRVSRSGTFLIGNQSAPPTDDTAARYVQKQVVELNNSFIENSNIVNAEIVNLKAKDSELDQAIVIQSNIVKSEIYNSQIEDFTVINGVVQGLKATDAEISGKITAAEADIGNLKANKADISELEANYAHITNGVIDNAKIGYADVNDLNAHYANIDLANVNNAWIQNGVIKDAAITDAQIIGVGANKITAGVIDASKITVTNLNADNITAGTINGQRIGTGSLSLDKLAEEVPTKEYLDDLADNLQGQIDGQIETWTGTTVPTLNNAPAVDWKGDAKKLKAHVGDIYYVVNDANDADGYTYRFAESGSGSSATYSWTLIKDNQITKALQEIQEAKGDISGIKQFDSDISSWKTDTDEELSSLKGRTTTLETDMGTKVSTQTFNELSQTVDENTASISSLSETVDTKADGSTVQTLSNTVNTVKQTADTNKSNITNLTKKVDDNETDIEQKYSDLTQDLNGFKTTVGSTYHKISDFNTYKTANDAAVAAAKKAGDDAQDDLDDYKDTVEETYATKSALTQTESSIKQEVSSTTKSYTDGKIAQEVSDRNSAINQKAEAITASVSSTYATKDSLESAKSEIKATTDGISTEVAKKTDKASIISTIRQSAESVKIKASQVEIDGTATFNAIKASADAAYDAKGAADAVQIGGRNLATKTGVSQKLTTRANQNWFVPNDIFKLSDYGSALLADENNQYFTISYDYVAEDVATAFILTTALMAKSNAYPPPASSEIVHGSYPTIAVGDSSGHASFTFMANSGQRTYGPQHGFAFSGSGNGNADVKLTISNFKFELGNRATDWTPAPEDVQAEIDTKRSTHTLMSSNSSGASYSTILGYAAEGHSEGWNVISTEGVRKGDTVRIGYYVSDMNKTVVYIVGTVTSVDSATHLTMTSHGLDTTVIDGGNILTNSITAVQIASNAITADELDASSINVSKSLTVGALTDASQSKVLNSAIEMGGRNFYGYNSDCTTLDGKNVLGTWNIVTEDGLVCAHTTGALKSTRYLQSKITFTPKPMEKWTFSADVKVKNIVRGTTNPMCEFYFGGATIDGSWRGWSVVSWILDRVETVSYKGLGFDRYITDTNWHHVEVTVYFNYNGTSTIPAMYPNVYLRDATGDLYIRNIKLEKGNKATDWTPAPEDLEAATDAAISAAATDATNKANAAEANAKKEATNYIYAGSDGIKIANADPEHADTYQKQTADSTEFYVDGVKRSDISGNGMRVYDNDGVESASFGRVPIIGKSEKNHLQLDDDSVDFMDGDTLIGYVGSDSARFPVMHVQSRLSIGDKYELRVTPSGSLGLYLM